MPVPAADLRAHMKYSAWASARLVAAAAELSGEDLTRDFGTSDHHILGTLAHVYAADRIWLGRIHADPPPVFIDPAVDHKLEVLQKDWPALLARWDEWMMAQSDVSVQSVLTYKNIKGESFRTPLWQIVLHVVNHGTHHRGQVSGFLRSIGRTPPPLDLIAYYRETA